METGRLATIPTHPGLPTLLLLGIFGGTLPAQSDTEPGCDPSAIRWFLPGQFEQAQRRAKEGKRLLIIKGISFGVDEAGAKCATKGKW